LILSHHEINELISKNFPHKEIRTIQQEAIFNIIKSLVNDNKKYFILECPTGGGKSAIALTVARILKELFNHRSTICTSTIALQDQYLKDFPELANLMGKNNYDCTRKGHNTLKYNEPVCSDLQSLKLCNPRNDCPYVIARDFWQHKSNYRITNTHFMIKAGEQIYSGLDQKAYTQFMVIDEAHTLPNIILSHCSFKIEPLDLTKIQINESFNHVLINEFLKLKDLISKAFNLAKIQDADCILRSSSELIELASNILGIIIRIEDMLLEIKEDYKADYELTNSISEGSCNSLADYRKLYSKLRYPAYLNKSLELIEDLHSTYELISIFELEEKVIAKSSSAEFIEICPITAKSISEHAILIKSDKFLFMSATICGMNDYVEELGLNPSDVAVLSMNSPFEIARRKISYIPVAKFSYSNREEAFDSIIKTADKIIDIMYKYYGKPVRGLIHSGTYTNAQIFKEKSKFSSIIETPKNIRDAIKLMNKKI
jgi:ATP-dependent DNA helicase DinG